MTRTIILELDEMDYAAVQAAIARRQTFRDWPDAPEDPEAGESNLAGIAVAEICRGWIEMLETKQKE